MSLKLFFDEFPETKETSTQFKGFILGLKDNHRIREAGFTLRLEDIVEIRSHDHVIAQCLDVVLGAMSFRLNDKHKEKQEGKLRRGKRTVAKEELYKNIVSEIRSIKPGFNIGVSTRDEDIWKAPYRHWKFRTEDFEFDRLLTKTKK